MARFTRFPGASPTVRRATGKEPNTCLGSAHVSAGVFLIPHTIRLSVRASLSASRTHLKITSGK